MTNSRFACLVVGLFTVLTRFATAQTTQPPDLSGPEQTVRSFVVAYNAFDQTALYQCIEGFQTTQTQTPRNSVVQSLKAIERYGRRLEIDNLRVRHLEDTAAKSAIVECNSKTYLRNVSVAQAEKEKLWLHQKDGKWLIVPAKMDDPRPAARFGKEKPGGSLFEMANVLANVDWVERQPFFGRGNTDDCEDNLSVFVEAVQSMFKEFGGTFSYAITQAVNAPLSPSLRKLPPSIEEKWQKALWRYHRKRHAYYCLIERESLEQKIFDEAKANGRVAQLPMDVSEVFTAEGYKSYAFNQALNPYTLQQIPKPNRTILFYEGKDGKLDFRHDGKAVVAFVSGKVKAVNEAEAKKLIWNPKE